MTVLRAITSLRIAPKDLGNVVREAIGRPMRREGIFAQIAVAGAMACLADAKAQAIAGSVGLLWGSANGSVAALDKVLDELVHQDANPMPFDFIASQCSVTAVYLAQSESSLGCAVFMPSAGTLWEQMLSLAHCRLQEGRFAHLLCGFCEEAEALTGHEHVSDWVLVSSQHTDAFSQPVLRVLLPEEVIGSIAPQEGEFVPNLLDWLHKRESGALKLAEGASLAICRN